MNIFEIFKNAEKNIQWPKLVYPFKNKMIVVKPTGPGSKHKNQLYVLDGIRYGSMLYCRITQDKQLHWYNTPHDSEITEAITKLINNPLETAKLHGQQFAYCCFCSIMIRSKSSLAVGYGPICAEKWGLPWGIDKDNEDITENL